VLSFEQRGGVNKLLTSAVGKYFITRGDMEESYFLAGGEFRLGCDVNDPSQTGQCSDLFDVETIPLPSLLAPTPFDRFQAAFGTANPDASSAYLVLNAGEARFIYDGEAEPVYLDRTLWHDPYGNVQFESDLGATTIAGDERIVVTSFAEDPCYEGAGALQECFPSAFPRNLHNLPSQRGDYPAIPGAGPQSATTFSYDGLQPGWATRGNLARTTTGLGSDAAHVDYVHGANTYGLPSQVSDRHADESAAVFTASSFDPSQTFVVQSTVQGLTNRTRYDPPDAPPGMGLVYIETDENGAWTARGADAFGRPTDLLPENWST
jgi:hypothetical protein